MSIIDVDRKGTAMNGCVSLLITLHRSGGGELVGNDKLKMELEAVVNNAVNVSGIQDVQFGIQRFGT